MKVLNPNDSIFSIQVITRDMDITTPVSVTLTEDGSLDSETISVTPAYGENYCTIEGTQTILSEGNFYFLEIKDGDTLLYRDRVYATQYSDDHFHSLNNGRFEVHDDTDDNGYVIHE